MYGRPTTEDGPGRGVHSTGRALDQDPMEVSAMSTSMPTSTAASTPSDAWEAVRSALRNAYALDPSGIGELVDDIALRTF